MYKVHVFYPNSPGVHFDLDYYAGKHMSMVRGLLGPNCTGVSVQAGLAGGAPGQPATYIAIGALDIASLDEFGAAMSETSRVLLGQAAGAESTAEAAPLGSPTDATGFLAQACFIIKSNCFLNSCACSNINSTKSSLFHCQTVTP